MSEVVVGWTVHHPGSEAKIQRCSDWSWVRKSTGCCVGRGSELGNIRIGRNIRNARNTRNVPTISIFHLFIIGSPWQPKSPPSCVSSSVFFTAFCFPRVMSHYPRSWNDIKPEEGGCCVYCFWCIWYWFWELLPSDSGFEKLEWSVRRKNGSILRIGTYYLQCTRWGLLCFLALRI